MVWWWEGGLGGAGGRGGGGGGRLPKKNGVLGTEVTRLVVELRASSWTQTSCLLSNEVTRVAFGTKLKKKWRKQRPRLRQSITCA
jgi:hypothetical protein